DVVAIRGEALSLLAGSLCALPRQVRAVGPPPCASTALGVGDLDGAALAPGGLAQEPRRPAAAPPAASPRGRATPAQAWPPARSTRSARCELEGERIGYLTHP